MHDHPNTPYNAIISDFPEVRRIASVIAFYLGMAVIAASIFLGRSYTFYFAFLVLAVFITLLWRNAPRPWIYMVSIVAATPIAIFKQQFTCNIICAFCFTVLNMKYLSKLPKWIYVLTVLALCGFIISSTNWIGENNIGGMLRQVAFAFNFLLAPFILLPIIYCRMEKSRDNNANLQGLLFCLIVPSTLVLISSKLFGTLANSWEASLHIGSLPEGFLQYRIGLVLVSFLRTEVGFILAALICASSAIAVSQVKAKFRMLAGACLVSNTFLLLATGSFGSGFACLCGLASIFYTQLRVISTSKVLASVVAMCCMLLLIFGFLPPSMKKYLEKRYEHRVVNADKDRLELWTLAMDYYLEHPLGVGFTFSVGEKVKTVIHNDYLAYTVSYSFLGGLAYTSLVAGMLISFFQNRKNTINDPSALATYLAGLGVIVVLAVNSITDHLAENRWYFNLIWSLIWYCYFCNRAVNTGIKPEDIEIENIIAGASKHHGKYVTTFT